MTPTGASPDVEREKVARIIVQHFTSGPWWQPDGSYAGHCDNGLSFAGDDLKAAQFDYGYKLTDAILSALSSDRRVEDRNAIKREAWEEAAAFLDGYAGGHYIARPCASAIRSLPVGGKR